MISTKKTRREFLAAFGAGIASVPVLSAVSLQAKRRKPINILYIMADDHAANAISAYGGILKDFAKTPNIDRLAVEGQRLDNCFCTNSICTPSRAAILTGQYSHINGVLTLSDALDPNRQNVAKHLQAGGYQTAIIGKWHLKTPPSGFEYWNVLPGQGRYHNPEFKEKGVWSGDLIRDGKGKVHEGYASDVITDLALSWLQKRDRTRPFFLMCHHKAPHGKWEYAERHAHLFENEQIPEPASLWEDKSHRSEATRSFGTGMLDLAERMSTEASGPAWPTGQLDIRGMTEEQKKKAAYQKYIKEYLRCVIAVDENVGRVLNYLDQEGLRENTVVVYTSDQGMFLGEHDYYDKRWMYEEALKMPFLVRYPSEIKAGSKNDDIILNVDFAPTFLDYAGLSPAKEMQGRSFRLNLAGKTPGDWRTSMYYRYWMHMASHAQPGHYGVRTKKYKLIFFYGLPLDASGALEEKTTPGWELYDLEKDPRELQNVYGKPEYAEVTAKLKVELLRLKDEFADDDSKYPELMKVRERYWQS